MYIFCHTSVGMYIFRNIYVFSSHIALILGRRILCKLIYTCRFILLIIRYWSLYLWDIIFDDYFCREEYRADVTPKSLLLEHCHKSKLERPKYETVSVATDEMYGFNCLQMINGEDILCEDSCTTVIVKVRMMVLHIKFASLSDDLLSPILALKTLWHWWQVVPDGVHPLNTFRLVIT